MVMVHFIENKTVVLSQLLQNIPTVDEKIKIKGRKGKVLSVRETENKQIEVQIEFEKVTKAKTMAALPNKKKR
ncbi:hypothetical protein ACE38V_13620 [Cytobacillus sp. Hz8]|uniref:hypothetical protein n=1 Tax=Cytobacillus sp. Hz8 TaxID=3347168 RepID=UPI0035E308F7